MSLLTTKETNNESEGDGFFIETPEPEDKQMSFNFNNITKMERPNGKDK